MMPDMHPLGLLITEQMRRNNLTLDKVVAQARARGEKLGRANLNDLQKSPPKSLTRKTIFGLAAGLGVTPLTVANAALASMGISPLSTEVTDALATIDIDPSLNDRDRRRLRALIVEMRADSADDGKPWPPKWTPRQNAQIDRGDEPEERFQL